MNTKEVRAQRLKPNDGSRRFLFYDIETDGLDATQFLFGVVMDMEGNHQTFYSAADMRRRIENEAVWLGENSELHVYGHNSNRYDIFSMFTAPELLNMNIIGTNDMTRIIAAQQTIVHPMGTGTVWWCDNTSLHPNCRLSELGEALGVPKGETPAEMMEGTYRATFGNESNDWPEEHIAYCVNDCEVLRLAFLQFWDTINELVGSSTRTYYPAWTSSSNAWRYWCMTAWPEHWAWNQRARSRGRDTKGEYLRNPDGTIRTYRRERVWIDEHLNACAGKAYFGGRSEVLTDLGATHHGLDGLDVNAFYPSVMVKYPFPDPRRARNQKPAPGSTAKELLTTFANDTKALYICDLTLTAGPSASRFLPTRTDEGRLNWSGDHFTGWLCQPEIEYALTHGWEMDDLREMHRYERMYPFKQVQQNLYDLRLKYKAAQDPRAGSVKILNNGLYGVFAMKTRHERITHLPEIEDIMSNPAYHLEYDLNFWDSGCSLPYLTSHELGPDPHRQIYAFAAFITSYARTELQAAIDAIGRPYCYYCDTDSIWFSSERREHAERLLTIHSTELGAWDWVDQDVETATFWEPKAYVMLKDGEKSVKHKGCSQSDGDLTKPQTHRQVRQWATALRRGQIAGESFLVEKRSRRHCVE